jgi:uridine phosphorylase
VIGVESECAAVAIVSAALGVRAGALLFCTDNVTLPREKDHGYRGLEDPRVKHGFECGLEAALSVLSGRSE